MFWVFFRPEIIESEWMQARAPWSRTCLESRLLIGLSLFVRGCTPWCPEQLLTHICCFMFSSQSKRNKGLQMNETIPEGPCTKAEPQFPLLLNINNPKACYRGAFIGSVLILELEPPGLWSENICFCSTLLCSWYVQSYVCIAPAPVFLSLSLILSHHPK